MTKANNKTKRNEASPAGGAAKAAADAGRRQRLPFFNENAKGENAAYPWKRFLSPEEKSLIKPVAQRLVKELRKLSKLRDKGKEVAEDELPDVLVSRGPFVDGLLSAKPAAATDLPRAMQILGRHYIVFFRGTSLPFNAMSFLLTSLSLFILVYLSTTDVALSCVLYIHNKLFTFKRSRVAGDKGKKKKALSLAGMKEEMSQQLGVSEAIAQAFLVRFCDSSEKAKRRFVLFSQSRSLPLLQLLFTSLL